MSKTNEQIYEYLGFPETPTEIFVVMQNAREDERDKIREVVEKRMEQSHWDITKQPFAKLLEELK